MRDSAGNTAKGRVFVTGQSSDANCCKVYRSVPRKRREFALVG